MTRDYAKKNRPAPRRNRPKSQVPGWVWLFTGLVLGGFIVFLARLTDVDVPEQPQQTAPKSAPKVAEEPKPEKQDTPKPRFDFYKLLRESEVIVPATEPSERQANNDETQEASKDEFILQVGSFRKSSEADSLRAQLLLLNLDAYTEQVTLNNNEVWHRVLVGPFNNQSRLASARATLVSNDYHALVLKRKRDD
ncbi:SPOR domain-containing protein [Marinimicrobium agarilyticum]|uniref:SPOR domain-containing protein n=1 Tax=Marinimicrobium agarilyticum TaxID=306546 RepID=UPI00041F284B|nr:SPOR domain-containing protein [Marinimicrobium agarilyticum]